MATRGVLWMVAALVGCGGAGARARVEIAAETSTHGEAESPPGSLPERCVPLTLAAGGSGLLSARLVRAIVGDTSAVVAEVACTCAQQHGVYAPARLRVHVVAVPGRGAIERASAAYESGDHQPRDWRGFQACMERESGAATIPVHVIGSDSLPDPDATDERVSLPVRIELLGEDVSFVRVRGRPTSSRSR